ncbi:helix-turn-helix transcriptional regulator [Fusobacterium hwasookii]|uniref:Transcriptional regulator n=1 Tax=Fusobacterium hwasookii ChDC F174 TaxID=1307442 RepID=A0A0S2ZN98_9FUSO|nr:helix-turn-helix transcriptional regulator [Fusobacterium hwasookii]ALQ37548.1 transcriptional regulator [Fusobacterium hwasookii ChDC F300]ALQ40327.1 transcriptional regulator [Fusobacterium hwasookii ChDC F174]QNE67501.1 helix-turn-helix transcriptional regulator [Fusobacterium hwasookii]QYR54898.1 helix-turn-helix transcriptional regulator [Fusobacterium hwasookii]
MELTERQRKILMMLKEKSLLSGDEIAQNLNVTKSALRTDFSILTGLKLITAKQNKGYIYNEYIIKRVRDYMSPQNSINVKTSVYDAIIHLFNFDLGTLIVVENEKLVGIISRKDLLKAALNGKNIEKIPVSMIMTRMPNIVHCFEDDNIMEAIEKLIKHEIDSLPVLRKEKGKLSLVGRFTKTNVTKLFYQELKNKSI